MLYTQETRRLILSTPLGEDRLIIASIQVSEGVSRLYHYEIECYADPSDPIPLGDLIRQPVAVTIKVDGSPARHLHGIVTRVRRGSEGSNGNVMDSYILDVGPPLVALTRREQSRIFLQKSVPNIIKELLAGIDARYQIAGNFQEREFCVQYRETDFNFFSRLCEDEGIFYFFDHTRHGVTMVLANSPQAHPDLPARKTISYTASPGSTRQDLEAWEWQRCQTLGSGKITYWDSNFQLAKKSLEASRPITDVITAGREKFKISAGTSDLEIYDYPGGFAERFDEVSVGGGDQTGLLNTTFQDNERTVSIRAEAKAVEMLVMQARTNSVTMVPGFVFDLEGHVSADDRYVILSAEMYIRQPLRPEEENIGFEDDVRIECIPKSMPYRPPRFARVPVIPGPQTAFVVGPDGEEIFTDKYGRVKVAFQWDRASQANATSSCWVRVAQPIAGAGWGHIGIPRVGQEVIVCFVEGDPDRPIIVGGVYNSDGLPPYTLPDHKTMTAFKTRSTPGGGGFNELRFEDAKGMEQVFLHGQKDLDVRITEKFREYIGDSKHLIVKEGMKEEIGSHHSFLVKGDQKGKVDGDLSIRAGNDYHAKAGNLVAVEGGQEVHVKGGTKVIVEASTQLSMKVGGNFIDINSTGVYIKGSMVMLNSGGSAGSGSGCRPEDPDAPDEADTAEPGQQDEPPPKYTPSPLPAWTPMALTLQRAAESGAALCNL